MITRSDVPACACVVSSLIPPTPCRFFCCTQLYLYLTVAFLEMTRASLPVIVMIALWVTGIEIPSSTVVRAVMLTAVGCAIAAYGEMHLTFLGVVFCVINLALESIRLVLMQVRATSWHVRMLISFLPATIHTACLWPQIDAK